MHRFHLPAESCRDDQVLLTGREAHHGLRVVRLRQNEPVVVLDGCGLEWHGTVMELGRDTIRLRLTERVGVPPAATRVTLVQAIPKGRLFDAIVQKSTELGVARIVPILSTRVLTHIEPADRARKGDHWRLVAIEAIKQCGSAWLPVVDDPVTLTGFLSRREPFDLPLLASLQAHRRHPRECLERYRAEHDQADPGSICIWIGPEGDFSPEELEAITGSGAWPISLGDLVLRTDTATVSALAVIQSELAAPRHTTNAPPPLR